MISAPTERAAMSCARCNDSACSGSAERRLYTLPSHSFAVHGIGPVVRRRRSRNESARSRWVRSAGDSGGSRRKASAAARRGGERKEERQKKKKKKERGWGGARRGVRGRQQTKSERGGACSRYD